MTRSRHLVLPAADARPAAPTAVWAAGAAGYRRWDAVGEGDGSGPAVVTGLGICELEPDGRVPSHVQSYEESVYVLAGTPVLQLPGLALRLRPGDYALVPLATPHSWRAEGEDTARWIDMLSPQPRSRYGEDAYAVAAVPETTPVDVDARDPRTRLAGHIETSMMDPGRQGQQHLAQSASMRTALLVYSGITVKMMVDSDLGADLQTMFMVHYDPDGQAGPHDHPFEETYVFLEGRAVGSFDGEEYDLGPGDIAFAGAGCVHAFRNAGDAPLRWIETQAPQPPGRDSYRFVRDWSYLQEKLGGVS